MDGVAGTGVPLRHMAPGCQVYSGSWHIRPTLGQWVSRASQAPPGPSHPTWCLLCSSRCLSTLKAWVRRHRWHPPIPQGHAGKWVRQGEVKSLGHLGTVVASLICLRSGHVLKLIYSHPGCEPPSPPGLCSRRPGYLLINCWQEIPRPLGWQ